MNEPSFLKNHPAGCLTPPVKSRLLSRRFLRSAAGALFCCLILLWNGIALAAEDGPGGMNEEQELVLADRLHRRVSSSVLNAATKIDGFFYEENTEIEENKTTLKVRLETFFEEGEKVDFSPKASLKLVLPGLEDKVHLTFSGDPEDDDELFGTPIDTPPPGMEDQDDDGVSATLRYFFENGLKRNTSVSVGARVRDGRFVVFPEGRYRQSFDFDPVALNFEQRIIWYSDTGWQSKTKFDFDNLLLEKFFLRTTLSGNWYEEKSGYFYSLGFQTYQTVFANIMLKYSLTNSFETSPAHRLTKTVFQVEYRQQFWRKWLFFGIIPQISFPEERDYEAVPGILFKIEGIFGYMKKSKNKASSDRKGRDHE